MAFDTSIAVFRWSPFDAELMEIARFTTAYQPLLMTYIGPKSSSTSAAEQIHQPQVLVFTNDEFAVTCLSYPDLTVKWKTKFPGLSRSAHEFAGILSIAEHAMVADYTALYKGDVGAIFLTLRFDYERDVAQAQGSDEADMSETLKEEVRNGGEAPETKLDATMQGGMERDDRYTLEFLTQPSFYALDLTTGTIRWRNTAKDDHSRLSLHDADADAYGDEDQEEMSQTAHDYRRHLAERAIHFEEGNWRIWKDDLIELALPHQWYTTRHTSLSPVRFAVNQDELASRRGRRNVPGFSIDFEDPYHYLAHTYLRKNGPSSNNVLLYEHSDGITVIHLYTGRILTRLSLPPYRTYADANGDATINSVIVDEDNGLLHMSTLYEEYNTVNHSQVYTVKLPVPNSLSRLHRDAAPARLEFSPPLLLSASTRFSAAGTTSKIRSPTSGFKAVLGKTLSQILPDIDHQVIPDKAYFIMFMNSEGMLYCVRSDTGEVQWVVETPVGWADLQALRSAIYSGFGRIVTEKGNLGGHVGQDVRTGAADGTNDMNGAEKINRIRADKYIVGSRRRSSKDDNTANVVREEREMQSKRLSAHLLPFSIDAKDTHPTGIMAVTPAGLVLVAPDGAILARQITHMPSVSKTTLPIVADINNDGRNDLIIVTHRSYHFFFLMSGKSHVYPLLVTLFLLALVGVVINKFIDSRSVKHEITSAIENLDVTSPASAEAAATRVYEPPVAFLKAE